MGHTKSNSRQAVLRMERFDIKKKKHFSAKGRSELILETALSTIQLNFVICIFTYGYVLLQLLMI